MFTRSGSGWSQQGGKLTGGGEGAEGEFGDGVALGDNGYTALIGAPQNRSFRGGAWVFQQSSQCPSPQGALGVVDWGINGVGQLASGFRSLSSGSGTGYENAPQPVSSLGAVGVTQVKAGFKFGLGLLGSSCTVEAWGSGNRAQLGDGSLADQSQPVTVKGLPPEVKEIAAAGAHAMALMYNGTVWTWGASEYGERGNGESDWEREALPHGFPARQLPAEVEHLPLKVKQIAAGGRRDYALLEDGEVMAWGEDNGGKLGVEETTSANDVEECIGETHATRPGLQCSTIPRKVVINGQPLTGVEVIGAGEETGYAVKGGGLEVYSWGGNGKGQLGNPDVNHQGTGTPMKSRASLRRLRWWKYSEVKLRRWRVSRTGACTAGGPTTRASSGVARPPTRVGRRRVTKRPCRSSAFPRVTRRGPSPPEKASATPPRKKQAATGCCTRSVRRAHTNCWAWETRRTRTRRRSGRSR